MDVTTKLTVGGNGVLGCWLIAAPFVLGTSAAGRWNDVIVGTAVVLVAGYNYVRAASRRPITATGAGLVAVLGLWLVVAPFVLGLEELALWNDVVSGTLVASFGSYNAYVAGSAPALRATAQ
ncbi:SPW repeat protein [Haloterrigena sp. SYSU A558-1]|uniref:SPW repeat protein n=1 Tax=Haloterrigena gelatinilytica TaxID=2741724 RepID=A0A8J8GJU7_9EURY|nr:SPW repeat protein [Haloterrigena gelatinilytica]NUB91313.1 SPW repeat protein [Haloterrigena gelatinilytica]NUC72948.1 SPW repeat protein [Haloterrigena gelatinilytica]